MDADTQQVLGTAGLDLQSQADALGFKYGQLLPQPVTLQPNKSYFIVSQETASEQVYDDVQTHVISDLGVATVSNSVYLKYSAFAPGGGGPGTSYGPVNFQFEL